MMHYAADIDLGRNVTRRVEVIAVDDSGPLQRVTVMGLADEIFDLPLRAQGFGFSTVPPVGSVGIVVMMGGRPDEAILIGLEHPDHRPKNLAEGEAVLHASNSRGMKVELKGNDVLIRSPNGIVHINP